MPVEVVVKVRGVPWQIEIVGFVLMLIPGVTDGMIVVVSAFEVTVGEDLQRRLEVRTAVMTSPVTNRLSTYELPVLNTFSPFFFHW